MPAIDPRDVHRAHGATPAECDELVRYAERVLAAAPKDLVFPLGAEPHVADWREYADSARTRGVFAALAERLVQLRFPIEAGVSDSAAYREATRRGLAVEPGHGLELREPGRMRLVIHESVAGPVPVIIVGDRGDFERVVRALAFRNEPHPIPTGMGATIVSGLVNWDRVQRIRDAWAVQDPDRSLATWAEAFRELDPPRSLYQDRLIILSEGPYSGTPASTLGLDDEVWREKSLAIRLEHECTHYFTLRVFGTMQNNLRDELLADYAGIVASEGRFVADWFRHFMHPERLRLYRGNPPLSDTAFSVLARVADTAARELETADRRLPLRKSVAPEVLCSLFRLSLEEIASGLVAL